MLCYHYTSTGAFFDKMTVELIFSSKDYRMYLQFISMQKCVFLNNIGMSNRKRIGNKIAILIGLVEIIAMTILFFVMNHYLTRILEVKAIHDMNVIARDRAQIVERIRSVSRANRFVRA